MNPSGVHAVSDAGTAVLHDFRDHSLILCAIPNISDQVRQAGVDNTPGEQQTLLSDYPTSSLSLAAYPELPVYTSNDCTALAMGSTQAATQVRRPRLQLAALATCMPLPMCASTCLSPASGRETCHDLQPPPQLSDRKGSSACDHACSNAKHHAAVIDRGGIVGCVCRRA